MFNALSKSRAPRCCQWSAPNALWMEDPSLTSQPSLGTLPHPSSPALLALFFDSPGESGRPAGVGKGVLRRMVGGARGGPSKRHLGPDPHLGVLDGVHQNRVSPFTNDFSPHARVSQGIPRWDSALSVLIAEKIARESRHFGATRYSTKAIPQGKRRLDRASAV